jgi:spore coat protein A, manganese oxidase
VTPGGPTLSRRRLLRTAAGTAVAVAFPVVGGDGARARSARMTRRAAMPFGRSLPIPRVLDGAQLRIPIVGAEIPILPGEPTRMWTFGGDYPGPTIRRPTGEPTVVDFHHRLGARAGELSVHLHGGHTPSRDDGQPGGLTRAQPRSLFCDISPELSASASGNALLIRPGDRRAYHYPFTEAGEPSRAATHWYHDHRLDNTARNNWRGLQGMWITDDAYEAGLELPSGDRELPLVISDRSFDARNQLRNPFSSSAHAPNDGTTGKRILVNGAVLPHHAVRAARYRLRVLNASSFRAYNLELPGVPIFQIGSDGGLLPLPIPRQTLLVGPGERLDLIADFSLAAQREVVLSSVPRTDGPKSLGSIPYSGAIMQFRIGSRPGAGDKPLPVRLRPLPDWVTEGLAEPVSHEWRMTVGTGLRPTWLINDRTFDPAYADHRVKLGTTTAWRLINDTGVAHLLHLHHTSFVLRTRNGRPPAPWEAGLKETFFMDPGDKLEVVGRFTDFPGKYIVHCHMLDHEDHGLMSQFELYR